MKIYEDEETGECFEYDDVAVALWRKAEQFIEKSILPYMELESDNPEWWVGFAKLHGDIAPDVEKCVVETLKANFSCPDGNPEGIKTARDARSDLSWRIIDELRFNEPRPDQR